MVELSVPRFNIQQCGLPQAVRDKLQKIENHLHATIDKCTEISRIPKYPKCRASQSAEASQSSKSTLSSDTGVEEITITARRPSV